jgi:hypothetical protein
MPDHVSANYRYIAAYNEVNARIAQRQHTLSIFITLVVGLLAALVAVKRLDGQNNLLIDGLVYGFPVASICLTFLNYKYERTLTNLRQYLSELERLNNLDLELPSYNTEPRWAIAANQGRQFHDFTCAVLVAACNAISLGAICKMYPEYWRPTSLFIWINGVVAIISVTVILLIPRFSYKPKWNRF